MRRNTIDPGSTASASFGLQRNRARPEQRSGLGGRSPRRVTACSSRRRTAARISGFAATTISAFWEARPALNAPRTVSAPHASYVFAGDMNGDGSSGNDLIYIPKNTSEMNFRARSRQASARRSRPNSRRRRSRRTSTRTPYLSKHRGEYAERGGIFYPMQKRMDLSIVQDVFNNIGGKRNAGQFRIDFTNFGNLLNHNWGVSQRLVVPITQAYGAQILTDVRPSMRRAAYHAWRMASGQQPSSVTQQLPAANTGLSATSTSSCSASVTRSIRETEARSHTGRRWATSTGPFPGRRPPQ